MYELMFTTYKNGRNINGQPVSNVAEGIRDHEVFERFRKGDSP
jgi:hypothetical protein